MVPFKTEFVTVAKRLFAAKNVGKELKIVFADK